MTTMTAPEAADTPPDGHAFQAHAGGVGAAAPSFADVRVRWLPLWLFLWVFGVAIVMLVVLWPRLGGKSGSGPKLDPGVSLALDYATEGLLAWWAARQCRRAGTTLRQLVGPAPRRWTGGHLAGLTVALVLLSIGAFWLLWLPLSFVAPGVVSEWALADRGLPELWVRGAPVRSALGFLMLVAIGPLVEELLFRGVILHRWAHKWGAGRALVVSSVLFGLLHPDVLGHTAFGLVMGLLYIRTGSLWVPVACHMLNNALAAFGALLPWGPSGEYTLARLQHDWYVGVAALVLALPALYALRRTYLPAPGWRLPEPRDGADAIPHPA